MAVGYGSSVTAAPRPEFDAELKAGLAVVGGMFPPTITPALLDFMRTSYASAPIDDLLAQRRIERLDLPACPARAPGSSTPTPAG